MFNPTQLNLPVYPFKITERDGLHFIFDEIRKKHLVLTPEEWVRQHFIHYLIDQLHYPKGLIKVEGGLVFNTLQKRSDIVVFSRAGNPWMMIECKAPDLKLSKRTIRQASIYNHSLKAKYVVITNGMSHICCEIDWINSNTVVLDSMPQYKANLE